LQLPVLVQAVRVEAKRRPFPGRRDDRCHNIDDQQAEDEAGFDYGDIRLPVQALVRKKIHTPLPQLRRPWC
jgi:hypothetical protein